jgi:hypothetical protein
MSFSLAYQVQLVHHVFQEETVLAGQIQESETRREIAGILVMIAIDDLAGKVDVRLVSRHDGQDNPEVEFPSNLKLLLADDHHAIGRDIHHTPDHSPAFVVNHLDVVRCVFSWPASMFPHGGPFREWGFTLGSAIFSADQAVP